MNKYFYYFFLFFILFSFQAGSALSAYRVGDKVTNFTLTDLDGNSVTLFDFKNKAILLNFFATW